MLDLLDGKGPHDERGQEEELEEDEDWNSEIKYEAYHACQPTCLPKMLPQCFCVVYVIARGCHY